jgi:hypothetical protein
MDCEMEQLCCERASAAAGLPEQVIRELRHDIDAQAFSSCFCHHAGFVLPPCRPASSICRNFDIHSSQVSPLRVITGKGSIEAFFGRKKNKIKEKKREISQERALMSYFRSLAKTVISSLRGGHLRHLPLIPCRWHQRAAILGERWKLLADRTAHTYFDGLLFSLPPNPYLTQPISNSAPLPI